MPAISKIRFTNVIYEGGRKRYNDDIFQFDGHNGAILLENGGGKTVLIQTAVQAVLPHTDLAGRKIKETLSLEGNSAHIAIEWILNERPRRYLVTAVTLFTSKRGLDTYKYVYEYESNDRHSIENIPFTKETINGKKRPSSKEEMNEYYGQMKNQYMNAQTFDTIKDYHNYIQEYYKIVPSEWKRITTINGAEGGVESFFDGCKTTGQLVDNLLIPTVEEALAGKGTKDFVQIFEKNREYFKKHKQLRARIEESKKVEEQISYYVESFATLNEAEQKLLKKKEDAKALYNFSISENKDITDKIKENRNAKEELEKKIEEFNRKEASYRLKVIKEDLIQREKIYDDKKEKYNYIKELYEKKEKNLINLEVAKLKKEIKEKEDSISLYSNQLKELDKDEEIVDIEEKLHKNASEIRGIFEEEESGLLKNINYIKGQIYRYNEDLEEYKKLLERAKKEAVQRNNNKIRLEAIIGKNQIDMNKICNQVLDKADTEDIEEESIKWKKRIQELDENINIINKDITDIREEKEAISNRLSPLRNKLQNLLQKENTNNNTIEALGEAHDSLLLKLKEFRLDWDYFNSLYIKQPTILNYFEGKIEKLRKEKEELMQRERKAYKFYDEYEKSEYFTADPSLHGLIDNWKNQFNLLETGTIYVDKISKTFEMSSEEIYKSYPYWAITVITSQGEINKLVRKIEGKIDILTHPIYIITDLEARNIVRNKEKIEERYIFPYSWKTNLKQINFFSWKKEIKAVAEEASKERREKEEESSSYDRYLLDLKNFYDKYPYEYYKELQENSKQLRSSIDNLQRAIKHKENRLNQIEEEASNFYKKLREFEGEYNLLTGKIEKFYEYMNKKSIKKKDQEELFIVLERIQLIEDDIKKFSNKVTTTEDILKELNEDFRENKESLDAIINDDLYNEVKNIQASYTDKSKIVLKEERQHLKDKLNNKQRGREEIEKSIFNAKSTKERLERDLRNKTKMSKYGIIEQFEFPIKGNEQINRLIDEINEIKDKLNKIAIKFQGAEEDYKDKLKEYKLRKEDFHKIYSEVFEFRKSLAFIKEELEEEKADIEKESEYLESMKNKHTKELKDIEKAVNELEKYNTKFNYLIEEINDKDLSSHTQQEFPYKRLDIVKGLIKNLEKRQENVNNLLKRVSDHRNQFIIFCEDKIYDTKLKDMAVSGVNKKNSYKEILDWQAKMNERISRTIKISEDHMREYDKDLQHFINHLYTYIYDISQELRVIPRKTKVKIEDKWKEIYLFDVPTWDEQEGKEELRNHIDWMVNQLDTDTFKDEEGKEDYVMMKKYIEKWLQSKQLLKNVMKENHIKIKCRKVTNDGKISSAPHSWESSNKWSGGEKWSKNMALFLGVLNYLSEKRQHISANRKRHRTVIMDNPFGKASSDHVLDPVFFIAEQLGFQIIALTAHAEGKFIRDYFPVVYSCKLRPTADKSGLIISKEKEIRHTFFKDNDPKSLIRLGEQEQLSLFEVAMTK